MIEKSTSDRMEILSIDTEFQSKTMKLISLFNFLKNLIVADLPTTVKTLV